MIIGMAFWVKYTAIIVIMFVLQSFVWCEISHRTDNRNASYSKSSVVIKNCDPSILMGSMSTSRRLGCSRACTERADCKRYLYCSRYSSCKLYQDVGDCVMYGDTTSCSCYRRNVGCEDASCTGVVDPCDGVKCLNGTECVRGICECPCEYSGPNCEVRIISYQVTIRTGEVNYAGTNANVFIQFVGPKGSTTLLTMDDPRNNFEDGMVETFEVTGIDVGDLDHIVIGHDNRYDSAGWFLDYVIVKIYFTIPQIKDKIEKLRTRKKDGGQDEGQDVDKLDAEEIFDRDGNIVKVPYYEEYYFEHNTWIRNNSIKDPIQKELKSSRMQIYYSDKVDL